MDEKYILAALSRLYGISETLKPLPCRKQDDVYELIMSWTKEYLKEQNMDLVAFFEMKINDL